MRLRNNRPIKFPEGDERAAYLRDMFGQISDRYNLINHLIAFGQDKVWRRKAVHAAALPPGGRLLDVGSGTGDIALEALRGNATVRIIAVDFSAQMMHVGRRRPGGQRIFWCQTDALDLPFPDAIFDAVTSGYLVRNVIDVRRAFEEQMRVVKPGGRVVCLETSPPQRTALWPLVLFHFKVVIPLLGYLIARNRPAYRYLPQSTQAFMTPDQLAVILKNIGLEEVSYHRFMFGTMTVLVGVRPLEP